MAPRFVFLATVAAAACLHNLFERDFLGAVWPAVASAWTLFAGGYEKELRDLQEVRR